MHSFPYLLAEIAVVQTINQRLQADVFLVMGWGAAFFSGGWVRLSIEHYSDSEVAGKRTPDRQQRYQNSGKSKWQGPISEAPHVKGVAIHLGLRDEAGTWIPWGRMSQEMRAWFMIVVSLMKALGWSWGGDFPSESFKDWHHFEKRG